MLLLLLLRRWLSLRNPRYDGTSNYLWPSEGTIMDQFDYAEQYRGRQARHVAAGIVGAAALMLLAGGSPALAQRDVPAQPQVAVRAELEAQIRSVEAALGRVHAEQQSIYQQFQMVQEIRRSERQELHNPAQPYASSGFITYYDDVAREKQTREYRLSYYASQMDRLYARYRELEEQKRPLLEQLAVLAAQR